MPQMKPLVLKDHAGTSKSFNPRNESGGVATLTTNSGIPLGDSRVLVSLNRTTGGKNKFSFKLVCPVIQMNTVEGVARPSVVRTAYADVTLQYEDSSLPEERADLLTFLASAFDAASSNIVDEMVSNNEGIY